MHSRKIIQTNGWSNPEQLIQLEGGRVGALPREKRHCGAMWRISQGQCIGFHGRRTDFQLQDLLQSAHRANITAWPEIWTSKTEHKVNFRAPAAESRHRLNLD